MLIYCINPECYNRENTETSERCLSCGTLLLINNRIRLMKPLRPFTDDPYICTEIFEVDDAGTQWYPVRERRVMKVLLRSSPQLVKLFEREAQALQLIQHPNVPKSTYYDDYFTVSLENSRILHCLVMQKFEGQNLHAWIQSHGRISQTLALQWLQQLTEILDIVHRAGFFHRDIKPSNIIVQPNGQLALIDFGGVREVTDTYLAKISGNGGKITGGGSQHEITAICTPSYSPLEQINGRAVPQSDFYALGRTFVYCLTGIQVINLTTDEKTGRLIWRDEAPQIDKPFAVFLDELMAAFPGQRPQTTQVILQRLERLPVKSKFNRVLKSKSFKISAIILGLATIIGAFNVSTYLLSKFYFDQASRNKDSPQVAKKDYELAIKFNPQDVDAYNNLALVCQQLGDYKCVTNSYEAVFRLKPNKWSAHYGLGNFYDEQGKYDLASQQYELARKSSNQAIQAINNLSRLKNKSGEFDAAITLANEGLKSAKTPDLQAALYKNLGWAELGQKNYRDALTYLQKATELDFERTDAYCLLAQAQEALGKTSDSNLAWEVCLTTNSSLPEVQLWRQKVLQRFLKQ